MNRAGAAALLSLVVVATACRTGYAERVGGADRAYQRGDLDAAEQALQVGPDDHSSQADLLRLERAMVLSAAGRWRESSELLMAADARLEELDYTRAPITDLARQVFTVETRDWHLSHAERVLLNTLNLLNFLLLGEWEEAAVEARRARVLMTQPDLSPDELDDNPLAWALAGLALETAGRHAEAQDAWRMLDDADLAAPPGPGQGSVVLVVQADRAPTRVATHYWLPIQATLRRLQIPVQVARPRRISGARVRVDGGAWQRLSLRLDYEALTLERDARARARLLAAAAIQMIPRALLTDAVREGVGDGKGGSRDVLGEVGGVALDSWLGEQWPVDTRSWTLLPAQVYLDRLHLDAGSHVVQLELLGAEPRRVDWEFELGPGELAVLNLVSAAGLPQEEAGEYGGEYAGAKTGAPGGTPREGLDPLQAPDAGGNLSDTPVGQEALSLLNEWLQDWPGGAGPTRGLQSRGRHRSRR